MIYGYNEMKVQYKSFLCVMYNKMKFSISLSHYLLLHYCTLSNYLCSPLPPISVFLLCSLLSHCPEIIYNSNSLSPCLHILLDYSYNRLHILLFLRHAHITCGTLRFAKALYFTVRRSFQRRTF